MALNETHDPQLRSWVASANAADSDFPLQNLPFGVFRLGAGSADPRGGVAIGDQILDLHAAASSSMFRSGAIGDEAARAIQSATGATLNAFLAQGPAAWSSLRLALSRALREGATQQQSALRDCLIPQAEAQMQVPVAIGDYTDFYCSLYHALAVGRLLRPDNPLLPNYRWMPMGYHGRSSSIGISGQQFHRPHGQILPRGETTPQFMASRRMDYELELGVLIGTGNRLGTPIGIDQAESHIFGLCLLNDWSARDIQAWEGQPLGPFLAKNFASTISPWLVTLDALEPYRCAWPRPAEDPEPMPYLTSAGVRDRGAIDIELEVLIQTPSMRAQGLTPARVARSNYRHAYWTIAQMVAQHSVNGCNLQPGDLLGSGTLSGPEPAEACSLLELSFGGRQALTLPNGEERRFLEDEDEVTLRAWCEKDGTRRIGFGSAVGRLLPAT
jgi:fumarylacetoacetase